MTVESYDRSEYVERELTPLEIEERKTLHMKLGSERDENLAEIADKRSEIRALNVARKKLDLRSAQIRREVQSGKVLEPIPSRQVELALDLALPNPFDVEYPKARDAEGLHAALAVVLQGVLVPSIVKLETWDPTAAIFDAVAQWARVELAHMNKRSHPHLELPPRVLMPIELDDLRVALERSGSKARKKKAARRPRRGA